MEEIFEKAEERVRRAIEEFNYLPAEEIERASENIFGQGEEWKRNTITSDILDVILYTLSLCNLRVSGARIRNSLERVLKQEKREEVLCFFQGFKDYLKKTAYFKKINPRKRDFFTAEQWKTIKKNIEQYVLWRFKKECGDYLFLFGFAEEYRRYRDYLEIALTLAEKTYNIITTEAK